MIITQYALDSPVFMFSMTAFYLSVVGGLKEYMRSREAYSLKNTMMMYNAVQVMLNIYMVYGLMVIPRYDSLFGTNTVYNDRIRYFLDVHYFSKYFDFFDTFFMALRKKDRQISFLHVYHHASICYIWGGFSYIGHNNGALGFTALGNSVIHTIMYGHYLWTSLGYTNPFKKVVTQAQLIQFTLFIIHSFVAFIWEEVFPKSLIIIQLLYSLQMFSMFADFYLLNYKKIDDKK